MSETTLHRLARLQDPSASLDRDSFEDALRAAGWRDARIERAVAEVTRRSLLARVLWNKSTAFNVTLSVLIGACNAAIYDLHMGLVTGIATLAFSTAMDVRRAR